MKRWYVPLSFVIPLLVFSRLLQAEFVWDDFIIIPELAGRTNPFAFHGIPWVDNFYRPIAIVSLQTDYLIWKTNPFGFHLTNIIIHCLSVVVLFAVFRRFIEERQAFFGSLLFGVHPAVSEAVGWVSCRFDLLALLFSLLAIYCLLLYQQERKGVILLLVVIFSAFSVLSKETGLVMVLVLPAAVYFYRRESRRPVYLYVFLVLLLVVSGSLLLGDRIVSKYLLSGNPVFEGFRVLGLLIGKIFMWKLLTSYSVCILDKLGLGTALFSAVVLGLACFFLYRSLRDKTATGFGILWFCTALLPGVFISLSKGYLLPASDRFLYSALPGAAFLAVILFRRAGGRVMVPLFSGVCLLMAVFAYQRAGVWMSADALWRDANAKCEGVWTYPVHSLAKAKLMEGDVNGSESLYRELVSGIDKGSLRSLYQVESSISLIEGLVDLGTIREGKHDDRGAEDYFSRAESEYDLLAAAHPKSGRWELAPANYEIARFFYDEALREKDAELLSRALRQAGLAFQYRGELTDAQRLKAYIEFSMGRCEDAAGSLRVLVARHPGDEQLRQELTRLMTACGNSGSGGQPD